MTSTIKTPRLTSLHLALSAVMLFSTSSWAQDTLLIADAYIDVAKGQSIKDVAVLVSGTR